MVARDPIDVNLAAILECWPHLPDAEKLRIAEDVRTTADANTRSR
jgi:hypothetical protein